MTRDIRPAHPSDADAVTALVRRAYGKWVPVIGHPPKPMLADYRTAIATHAVFVIDSLDRRDLSAVLELVPAPAHLLIENIAVDPARQRQGVGASLLGFAEAEAGRRNLPALRLYTNALMEANIALYTRLGYRESERRPSTAGDSIVVYMEKPVRSR